MDKLQRQLASEILQDEVEIVHAHRFCLPVHTWKVTYHPVMKKPMDILMKMLLKAFQTGVFRDSATIAEVLLVESLFVNDLLQKMVNSGLIDFDEVYALTAKGEQQLADGVYEEQLDAVTELLQYSMFHETFLAGDIEAILAFEDFPEEVLEEQVEPVVTEQELITYLNEQQLEDEVPVFVTDIVTAEEIQINDVPCLAYICHDVKQDRLFARVYNTLTEAWDPVLEAVLHKDRATWRAQYVK